MYSSVYGWDPKQHLSDLFLLHDALCATLRFPPDSDGDVLTNWALERTYMEMKKEKNYKKINSIYTSMYQLPGGVHFFSL